MELCAHPTIPSDLTPEQVFESDTGILHASSSGDPTLTIQYWITTRSILSTFTQDIQEAGYDFLYFNPFSSKAAWTRLYPEQAISNTISVRLHETNPPTFPSLASSISTSTAPTTTPTHNSPSNQTVEPTTALVALMHQSLQQNFTMMVQLNSRPSPQPSQPPSPSYQYKPQLPPFPKWDGTPSISPLFLAQISTYKAEAFYAGVHDWTCTTLASQQLSVAISSDMLALLLSSISSMFLNDVRFVSDGIAIISLLLAHLNPSSNENPPLAISDLTRLEMRLGESSINYMSRVQGISQRMQGVTIEHIIPLFSIASLDHDRYPGVKSCYLAGDAALVNCGLLELSGLLSSEDTRQCALVIPNAPPSTKSREAWLSSKFQSSPFPC